MGDYCLYFKRYNSTTKHILYNSAKFPAALGGGTNSDAVLIPYGVDLDWWFKKEYPSTFGFCFTPDGSTIEIDYGTIGDLMLSNDVWFELVSIGSSTVSIRGCVSGNSGNFATATLPFYYRDGEVLKLDTLGAPTTKFPLGGATQNAVEIVPSGSSVTFKYSGSDYSDSGVSVPYEEVVKASVSYSVESLTLAALRGKPRVDVSYSDYWGEDYDWDADTYYLSTTSTVSLSVTAETKAYYFYDGVESIDAETTMLGAGITSMSFVNGSESIAFDPSKGDEFVGTSGVSNETCYYSHALVSSSPVTLSNTVTARFKCGNGDYLTAKGTCSVTGQGKQVVSLRETGDTGTYYDFKKLLSQSIKQYFIKPSVTATFNDGTTADVTSSVAYYADDGMTEKLTAGSSEITEDGEVFVRYDYSNGLGLSSSAVTTYEIAGEPVEEVTALSFADSTTDYWEFAYVSPQKFVLPNNSFVSATFAIAGEDDDVRIAEVCTYYQSQADAEAKANALDTDDNLTEATTIYARYDYTDSRNGYKSHVVASYAITEKAVERVTALSFSADSSNYWEFAYVSPQKFVVPTSSFTSVTFAVGGEGTSADYASACAYYLSEDDAEKETNALTTDSDLTEAATVYARYDYTDSRNGYKSHAIGSYEIEEKEVVKASSIAFDTMDSTCYKRFADSPEQDYEEPTPGVTLTTSDGASAAAPVSGWYATEEDAEAGENALSSGSKVTSATLWARVDYTDEASTAQTHAVASYDLLTEQAISVSTSGDGFKSRYYWASDADTAYSHAGVSVTYGDGVAVDAQYITFSDPEILWAEENSKNTIGVSVLIPATDEAKMVKGSSSYSVTGYPKEVVSLAASGSDTKNYYAGVEQKYAASTEISYTALYNDGTSASVTSGLSYYLTQSGAEAGSDPLNETSEVGAPSAIYVRYDYENPVPEGEDRFASHAVDYYGVTLKENAVASVSWKGDSRPTVWFGNRISEYKSAFSELLVVTLEHGETQDISDFSFKDDSVQMPTEEEIASDSVSRSVTLTYGSKEYALAGVIFAKPEPQTPVIAAKGALDYQLSNGKDGIDLRETRLSLTYKDGGGSTVAYSDSLSFDPDSNEAARGERYSVTCSDSLMPEGYKYSGAVITLDTAQMGGTGHAFELSLNAVSAFSSEVASLPVSVNVFDIDNVASISRGQKVVDNDGNGVADSCFRLTYYVGETFLDRDDKSNVRVQYAAKDTTKGLISIYATLADEPPYLNVYPPPGTVFTKAGQQTVTVRSAYDSSVAYSYAIEVVTRLVTASSEPTEFRFWRLRAARTYSVGSTEYTADELKEGAYVLVTTSDYDRLLTDGESVIAPDDGGEGVKLYGYTPYVLTEEEAAALRSESGSGYKQAQALKKQGKTLNNAKLTLFYDYLPEVSGTSNIEVEFPCYNADNAAFIDSCTFGKLFGNNNAKNRLFVSGNQSRKNRDWHSGAVLEGDTAIEANGDFSYFPDVYYCDYGLADNAVVGYDIVSDNKLLVLKTYSTKEPTVYYRTSTLVQATNDDGTVASDVNGSALYQESYPLTIGNNYGSGAISPRAIANFNGDTLFLSSAKELDGLDISGISGNSLRVANTRSRYIDPYFSRLSEAGDYGDGWLWCDADYLALVFPDGMFLTYFDRLDSETRQYEWWRSDVADVRCILKDEESIYGGRSDGSVVLLNGENFYDEDASDLSYAYLDAGGADQMVAHPAENYIQVSTEVSSALNPDYEVWYRPYETGSGDIPICEYAGQVRTGKSNGDCDILCTDSGSLALFTPYFRGDVEKAAEFSNRLDDGVLLAYGASESDPSPILATVRLSGADDGSFYLTRNGSDLSFATFGGGHVLAFPVERDIKLGNAEGKEPSVESDGQTAFESGKFTLLDGDGNVLDVCFANAINRGELLSRRPVKAFYVTGPMTMGTLTSGKTIWGTTITNDTGIPSTFEFCEITNDDGENGFSKFTELNSMNYKGSFSYKNFSFGSLNFERFITPHTTTYWRPIGPFPFIVFGFRSEEAANAVLSSVEVTYTFAMPTFGFYS